MSQIHTQGSVIAQVGWLGFDYSKLKEGRSKYMVDIYKSTCIGVNREEARDAILYT